MTISINHEPDEDAEPRCSLCGRARTDHYELHHEFTEGGLITKRDPSKPPTGDRSSNDDSRQSNSSPRDEPGKLPGGDPVLRIALIRAGVITGDNLKEVEDEFRASGISIA